VRHDTTDLDDEEAVRRYIAGTLAPIVLGSREATK
jgi:hypothetical protein